MNSELEIENIEIHQSIDTSGTRCPIPLLRAKKVMKTMESGQHLKVLATDPSAKPDFEAMLRHLPDELVAYIPGHGSENDTQVGAAPVVDIFIIRKA